ncbi:hypothetical protein BV22DRAFT_1038587 [Leucogyrophana mollusca]|uniref:Uncharacterized protein n=1 Tax=Leucogyrophana mollusca TaxID=85980 RepID=A0ACB8B9R8_9AGAM|nr:hypothetical protein BV22DRAFT_1038587 [Leucogyrophana mollusca]
MSEVQVSPSQHNDRSNLSLLSLSIVAASASPIVVAPSADSTVRPSQASHNSNGTKHRRLSSTGKAKRRLSDARDAAIRPSSSSLQTAATALSSLATLSLSSSPPTSVSQPSVSLTASTQAMDTIPSPIPIPALQVDSDAALQAGSLENESSTSLPATQNIISASTGAVSGGSIPINGLTKSGKKRGTTFTCESCSKVYRHPSCLIKHRWEHTPQWREASKFVLSKHQQVQLLEAAAILSHLSPSSANGTSLPEDRSLWPSFLSGGQLPPPVNGSEPNSLGGAAVSPAGIGAVHPISSSVPATSLLSSSRATSAGPRLHDYSVPQMVSGPGGITQLRPGLLGVPTAPSPANDNPVVATAGAASPTPGSRPVPVPNASNTDAHNLLAFRSQSVHSESWGSPLSPSHYDIASFSSVASHGLSRSYAPSDVGWSLPRSSIRSVSASSRSRSASESKSDDEGELVDVDDSAGQNPHVYGFNSRGRVSSARFAWKTEEEDAVLGFSVREEDEDEAKATHARTSGEEEWDGMDMDMEMD